MPAPEPLRVTAAGLRALAVDLNTARSSLAAAPTGAPAPGSDTEIATACAAVTARFTAAGSTLSGWTGTLGTVLNAAASAYDGTDATSAANLSGQVM